jgi:hypothetical protein
MLMTVKTLVLLGAVALAAAACSQEKEAESTAATSAYLPTTAPPEPVSALDTMLLRNDADVMAVRVARDLQITDPALITRIKNEYYARGRALQGYTAQYATDTASARAAIKVVNERTTRRLKTAFTPLQYQVYARRQAAYYAPPRATGVAPVATRTPVLDVHRSGAAKPPGARSSYRAPGAKV